MRANTDYLFEYRGKSGKSVGGRFEEILLQSDGSTTKMLELIVGGEVTVKVHDQGWIFRNELPPAYHFPIEGAGPFIRRVTSLYYRDEVISTNLVFGNPEVISSKLQEQLQQGTIPLGKLIKEMEYRRQILFAGYEDFNKDHTVFHPAEFSETEYPLKKYVMIREGQWWFYITEVFHMHTIMKYMVSDLNENII
ncbi:chorismate pyruvate-lyase family protein [Paenibacillus sp. SI8]|uniref:chorismate--pyruvate lyase family protein n=1 Tax=unclassified Paenibacillus TaxID=185978 RepID=UPI00346797DB